MMEIDKRIIELKTELIHCYTDHCMETLKQQGVNVGDGGRFYKKLIDLIEECIIIGELRI